MSREERQVIVRFFASGATLLLLIAALSGCVSPRAVMLWESPGGRVRIGSGPLPAAICAEELAALTDLYARDRSNYGQDKNDIRTWITNGVCVHVAPRWTCGPNRERPGVTCAQR